MITYYERHVRCWSPRTRSGSAGRRYPLRELRPGLAPPRAPVPGARSPGAAPSAWRSSARWSRPRSASWSRSRRTPRTTMTVALVGGVVLVGLAVGPLADFLLERMDRSYARGSRALEIWARGRGRPRAAAATGRRAALRPDLPGRCSARWRPRPRRAVDGALLPRSARPRHIPGRPGGRRHVPGPRARPRLASARQRHGAHPLPPARPGRAHPAHLGAAAGGHRLRHLAGLLGAGARQLGSRPPSSSRSA